MKTTIEVPDSLFEEIKRCAKTRGIPLREVIEDALRAVVRTQTGPAAFHLRNGSYGKPGLVRLALGHKCEKRFTHIAASDCRRH